MKKILMIAALAVACYGNLAPLKPKCNRNKPCDTTAGCAIMPGPDGGYVCWCP